MPAAGLGTRLGPGAAKAVRPVAGVPLVVRAVRSLDSSGLVEVGVVVAAPESCADVDRLVAAAGLGARWSVVAGGDTRSRSVELGLATLPADVEVVLVHDAARAFVPADVVRRVLTAVDAGADAVIPVLPVADTVKQVDPAGAVTDTLDRSSLRQVQTPQGFRRSVLDKAYAAAVGGASAAPAVTDDAGLVERLGGRVVVVAGDALAFKVTGPLDLILAEAVARDLDGGAG